MTQSAWVLIQKLVEMTGYSEQAIRAKVKKGVWISGVHWRKAPDGHLFFSPSAITAWIEGTGVRT